MAAHLSVSGVANGTQVQLLVGQSLKVSLDANPTTGYQWSVVTAGTLEVASKSYVAAKTDRVGSGGTEVIVFTAPSAGTQHLALGYSQPFDATVPAAKTFTLTVVVTAT
jgi:inhibitor of cysteine peptidase